MTKLGGFCDIFPVWDQSCRSLAGLGCRPGNNLVESYQWLIEGISRLRRAMIAVNRCQPRGAATSRA